ncbi:MAG: DUF2007 domain-containing protein [Prolixibacteraceae bacterium]|nr:DUF2007 domain-containing protein [Prolixibacteraceae bacterium]
MKERNELIRVFTGSEVSTIMLQGALDEIGVGSMVQNDAQSGMSAGIGGFSSFVDLYIQQSDLKNAEPLINEFTKANNE